MIAGRLQRRAAHRGWGLHDRLLLELLEEPLLFLHGRELTVRLALLKLTHPPQVAAVHGPARVDVVNLPRAMPLLNRLQQLRVLRVLQTQESQR